MVSARLASMVKLLLMSSSDYEISCGRFNNSDPLMIRRNAVVAIGELNAGLSSLSSHRSKAGGEIDILSSPLKKWRE